MTYSASKVDPQLLTGSDIIADALPGLRKPNSNTGSISLLLTALSSRQQSADANTRRSAGVHWRLRARPGQTELSRTTTDNYNASLNYSIAVTRHGSPIHLNGLVNSLPTWMRESDFGNSLKTASYTLLPTSVRLRSGLARDQTYFYSYVSPIERPIDASVAPALALNYVWRNSAGLTWQPLGMLTFTADVASSRDLRQYGDSTPQARLATAERRGPPRRRRGCGARPDLGHQPGHRAENRLVVPAQIRHHQQLCAQPLPQQPPAGADRR